MDLFWQFFWQFFWIFIKKSEKISYFRTVYTENVRESRNFGIIEQEKKIGDFFWEIFQDLSVVRESRKFSNSEREYRIPENAPYPKFRNSEAKKFGNGPTLRPNF